MVVFIPTYICGYLHNITNVTSSLIIANHRNITSSKTSPVSQILTRASNIIWRRQATINNSNMWQEHNIKTRYSLNADIMRTPKYIIFEPLYVSPVTLILFSRLDVFMNTPNTTHLVLTHLAVGLDRSSSAPAFQRTKNQYQLTPDTVTLYSWDKALHQLSNAPTMASVSCSVQDLWLLARFFHKCIRFVFSYEMGEEITTTI